MTKPAADEPKKQETPAVKESLRKEQPPPQKPDPATILKEKAPAAGPEASREELEQRRTILQNLKDFDFQIKKNQEDITNVSEKVESISKDLDDLVSLYEIVSEQMNPFVGLSKVTKKRLDALENIMAEVDALKTKVGDIETVFEKGGHALTATLTSTRRRRRTRKTRHRHRLLKPPNPCHQKPLTPTQQPATSPQPADALHTTALSPMLTVTTQPAMTGFSDTDLDVILSKAFESFFMEQRIDSIMNEFFQGLK